ncbi:MAG: FtsX-like permease family protein [Gemmataceae bacterium]
MYKWLLCWRYLLTRYLALACIVSITLGVATLIVVNSVMNGFSTKMQDRLHALLSDVSLDALDPEGFHDPEEKMKRIRASAVAGRIEAMTPTLETFAMLQYRVHPDGYWPSDRLTRRPIRLIGIDLAGRTAVGGFAPHIFNREDNLIEPTFEHKGRNVRIHHVAPAPAVSDPDSPPPPAPPPSKPKEVIGAILGRALATQRTTDAENKPVDRWIIQPGDDLIVTTVSGQKLAPVYDRFAVACYFKSELSEYDSQYVFVPLEHLQQLCTMQNRATSIQIKLKNQEDSKLVVAELARLFPDLQASGWQDKQGPLLAAISIERGILNVLLFMIVGVAGFGILAIFVMIVVEKTRDIGILKALGASNTGVMRIFLAYGLLLGCIGAACGTGVGVLIARYINEIEEWLTRVTGQPVFDKSIYYFSTIPTDISAWMLLYVNLGAIAIAVMSATLPALRAALLHPVRALRYE